MRKPRRSDWRLCEMEKKLYFDCPTQVIWYDEEDAKQFGIAYRHEIICACCGAIIPLEEVYVFAQRKEPIETIEWIDFAESIS